MINQRIAYHSAKRFTGILSWVLVGGIIGWSFPHVLMASNHYLGSPLYGLVPFILIPMIYFSVVMGRFDARMEKMRNEHVFNRLKED